MKETADATKRGFFGVVIEPQSYINIAYLLLAFPLGIAYFVFLVTGLSVGFGLIITLVGIPILLLVLGGSSILCRFERWITREMLHEQISQHSKEPVIGGWWPQLKAHLGNRVTWTGMFYLLLKFPTGIATFTIAVTLISLTIGLIGAPAYMWTSDSLIWGSHEFDPFPWSWILTLIGIPMIFISLHVMNGIASVEGKLARVMLGRSHEESAAAFSDQGD